MTTLKLTQRPRRSNCYQTLIQFISYTLYTPPTNHSYSTGTLPTYVGDCECEPLTEATVHGWGKARPLRLC